MVDTKDEQQQNGPTENVSDENGTEKDPLAEAVTEAMSEAEEDKTTETSDSATENEDDAAT